MALAEGMTVSMCRGPRVFPPLMVGVATVLAWVYCRLRGGLACFSPTARPLWPTHSHQGFFPWLYLSAARGNATELGEGDADGHTHSCKLLWAYEFVSGWELKAEVLPPPLPAPLLSLFPGKGKDCLCMLL